MAEASRDEPDAAWDPVDDGPPLDLSEADRMAHNASEMAPMDWGPPPSDEEAYARADARAGARPDSRADSRSDLRAEAIEPPRPSVPELPARGEDPLSDQWADTVAQLQSRGLIAALVRELAVQSQCVGQREEGGQSVWQLRVERVSLMGDMHKDRLTQAVSQLLGRPATLLLEQGVAFNTPAQRDLAAREARQRAAEALIAADPLVRKLLTDHPGARVLPGSVRPL